MWGLFMTSSVNYVVIGWSDSNGASTFAECSTILIYVIDNLSNSLAWILYTKGFISLKTHSRVTQQMQMSIRKERVMVLLTVVEKQIHVDPKQSKDLLEVFSVDNSTVQKLSAAYEHVCLVPIMLAWFDGNLLPLLLQ